MSQQQPPGSDPRIGLIHSLSGWVAVIIATVLLLEKWSAARDVVREYLVRHFPEYIDWLMIAAPIFAWLGAYLAAHLLCSSVLTRVYHRSEGA